MDARQARALLESLEPVLPDVDVFTGSKDREREPYLLLTSADDPDRWAVVYTDVTWTAVQTNTRFSKLHIDEEIADDELRGLLEDFVGIAVAYVQGSGEVVRTGFLRPTKLIVHVGQRREELFPGLARTIASIFNPLRGSAANRM